jgi:hypothetical protein
MLFDAFDNNHEEVDHDLNHFSLPRELSTPVRLFEDLGTAQFSEWWIKAMVTVATNCLVQQALMQSPVSICMDTSAQIDTSAIYLFLCISKLVINTGEQQQRIVCTILSMLFQLLPPGFASWPPMPCSLPAFQSHILNATNKHSLISLLPGPKVTMMADGHHAYCPLEEIAAFILLLPRTMGATSIPLRLRQLCQSSNIIWFLGQKWMKPTPSAWFPSG